MQFQDSISSSSGGVELSSFNNAASNIASTLQISPNISPYGPTQEIQRSQYHQRHILSSSITENLSNPSFSPLASPFSVACSSTLTRIQPPISTTSAAQLQHILPPNLSTISTSSSQTIPNQNTSSLNQQPISQVNFTHACDLNRSKLSYAIITNPLSYNSDHSPSSIVGRDQSISVSQFNESSNYPATSSIDTMSFIQSTESLNKNYSITSTLQTNSKNPSNLTTFMPVTSSVPLSSFGSVLEQPEEAGTVSEFSQK